VIERELLFVQDAAEWEQWLAANHASSPGVLLALAKKNSGASSPTHAEAIDAALCYGWIDSQSRRLDDRYFLLTFSPRGRRSIWSQINRGNVERLTAAGRMRPAGQREVDRARADGRWEAAYAPQASAEVPEDLAAALAASPRAAVAFDGLSRVNRYAILFRIGNVKRAETRARKITEYVAMLERGETLHPQAGRAAGGAAVRPRSEPPG
jgi:uncharacterized protein YdeI (YjbR/CyaY-like superfamily)